MEKKIRWKTIPLSENVKSLKFPCGEIKYGPRITYSKNRIDICFDVINIPFDEALNWVIDTVKENIEHPEIRNILAGRERDATKRV